MKRVAHVLWRSTGGMRRHVRHIAQAPPTGWVTSGVYGPPELSSYFAGQPFRPVTRSSVLRGITDGDLVHAHGFTAGLCALRPARPPVVLTTHLVRGGAGRTSTSPFANVLARLVTARADAIIAPSVHAASGIARARVIAPAVDELPSPGRDRQTVRRETGAADDDVVVITVARLEASKRVDVLIDAAERAGCVLWVVGDGAERALLAARAGDRVRFLGPRTDLADLYAAADIFALPTASESFGFAVAEALAAGLPVITTDTGAHGELMGTAGVLVAPDDMAGFTHGLCHLVEHADERAKISSAVRERTGTDPVRLVEAVGAVYDEVLARA